MTKYMPVEERVARYATVHELLNSDEPLRVIIKGLFNFGFDKSQTIGIMQREGVSEYETKRIINTYKFRELA